MDNKYKEYCQAVLWIFAKKIGPRLICRDPMAI